MLDRAAHAILVPAAHALGGIGAIRSLGAAGYRVHAAGETPDALGLKSRFATKSVVHPPVNSPAFEPWFRSYVQDEGIEMIVPGGGFHFETEGVFSAYSHLFPVSHNAAILEPSNSKFGLFEKLNSGEDVHRAHLPPFLLVDFDDDLPTEKQLAALGEPVFIKLDSTQARKQAPSDVLRMANAAKARAMLETLVERYKRVLVQGYVPGRGAGAFILRWNDRVIARMMHLRLHEMPHTGGASSLRVSWWNEAMMDDAQVKLDRMGWQGVAMVEYRWDPVSGKFYLMEVNFRLWGSLHLALYSGVDFPRLLADAFFGQVPDETVEGRRFVKCRNIVPSELGYLTSLWRDPAVPMRRKVFAGLEACWLTIDPRVYNDLLYPGDRMLFFRRMMGLFAR